MKVKVWLRNITTDVDFMLNLPVNNLNEILDKDCEYIITECDVLSPSEFDSIHELNNFLEGCEQNGIDEETLEVLSAKYLYHEVIQIVNDGTFTIIDFDMETADWYGGSGGDLWRDTDKGMCLYDGNYYNPFQFDMSKEIYEWINWESVWISAAIDGWKTVNVNRKHYLVHR